MPSAFAIHLGGGLYFDSDGEVTQGSLPAGTPVYEAPTSLPFDPNKAKEALQGVQKALKDVNKDPKVVAIFKANHLDTQLLDILSGVAKIAGIVAPVLAAIAVAYDLLKLFGVIKEGPSPLEVLVKQRFDELEINVEAIKTLIQLRDLRTQRIGVENLVAAIGPYVKQLQNVNPSLLQLENDYLMLRNAHEQHINAVSHLLSTDSWIGNFDAESYSEGWSWVQHLIHTFPNGPGIAPHKVAFPADGSLQFDHRLMVPLALYAAQSYLTCIRGILPEHRSSGEFGDLLRGHAEKMHELAKALRQHGLGRTVYRREDFAFPVLIAPHDVILSGSSLNPVATISPRCNRFPVGAIDLRYHDKHFFRDFFDGLALADTKGLPHPTKFGGMDFRWLPPAKLAPSFHGNYAIENPEECAAAANAQAEKDYIDLLATSGYLELVRVTALLRNESTEPDRSQTITAASPTLYRTPRPATDVTIQSEPIFATGVITSPARREPQNCISVVRAGTQPIKRARPLTYRIKLVTLRSIDNDNRWNEPNYSDYWRTRYDIDLDLTLEPEARAKRARFLKMMIVKNELALLDEAVLIDAWTATPREAPIVADGIASLTAHTFDRWVPVAPPFNVGTPVGDTFVELRAVGWDLSNVDPSDIQARGSHPSPPPPVNSTAGHFEPLPRQMNPHAVPELSWLSAATVQGQPRDPQTQQINVSYQLEWRDDRLQLFLTHAPADRCYVMFVVFEELLTRSGAILHTAIPVPVNGQLTYVPQSFFDAEQAAIQEAADTIADFNDQYREARELGPLDPIVGWLRPADRRSRQSLARVAQLAEQHEPDLLRSVLNARVGRRRKIRTS